MNSREKDNYSIKDLIKNTNPDFYQWLMNIGDLDVLRTLDVCTFLLNVFIAQKYFPWYKIVNKFVEKIYPVHLELNEIKEMEFGFERIYGVFILLKLKYNWGKTVSYNATDRLIDKLDRKAPLLNSFFVLNTMPYDIIPSDFLNYIHHCIISENLLPELGFDPNFLKITQSKAIKVLFDTTFISAYITTGKLIDHYIFPIDKKDLINFLKGGRKQSEPFLNIDRSLSLSNFDKRLLNNFGFLYLSSSVQIDEIISMFSNYYCAKVPSKKDEINFCLLCLGESLKLVKGKSCVKLRWQEIMEALTQKVPKEKAKSFMNLFLLQSSQEEFPKTYEDFDAQSFLEEYHFFLGKAGFYSMGFVRTGAFLIWRALIKYLERIQSEKEFYEKKGALLEKWCYECAIKLGFQAEKLILRNPNTEPTDQYTKMKEQIKSFPKSPIEIPIIFPEILKNACFREIDFTIRREQYLLLFECKALSAPIQELGDYVKWISNFHDNLNMIKEKADLIRANLEQGIIKNPFLVGVEKYIFVQIQTEGIFVDFGTTNPKGYVQFLEELSKHKDKESLDQFIKEKTKL